MNLRFLDTFLVIARVGSFRAAATELGITQAAISGRVATLETDLGQVLFERTARDSRLTPAGQMLLLYAKQLLATEAELREMVGGQTPLTVEPVRLGIKQELATLWLNDFFVFLAQLHPQIQLHLTTGTTAFLHQQLQDGSLDGIVSLAPVERQRGIRNRTIAQLPLAWVGLPPDQLPLAISLDEMARQGPLISSQPDSPLGLLLRSVMKKEKVAEAIVHSVVGIEGVNCLVRQGLGTALIPRLWVLPSLKEQTLCALPCLTEVMPVPVVVSWRSDSDTAGMHALSLALKAFLRHQATDSDGALQVDQ